MRPQADVRSRGRTVQRASSGPFAQQPRAQRSREAQIDYVFEALEFARENSLETLEVREEAEDQYVKTIDSVSEHTVWIQGGCQNWYVDPRSGRLTLTWPDYAYAFRDKNGTFSPEPYLSTLARGQPAPTMRPLSPPSL